MNKPDNPDKNRNSKGQFVVGNRANPAGRPRTKVLSEHYRDWLAQPSASNPERSNGECVAEVVGLSALAGDLRAAEELANRTEGRPRQSVDVGIDVQRQDAIRRIIADLVDSGMTETEAVDFLSTTVPGIAEWIN
jgi:uncharacterized protein DUF5681